MVMVTMLDSVLQEQKTNKMDGVAQVDLHST